MKKSFRFLAAAGAVAGTVGWAPALSAETIQIPAAAFGAGGTAVERNGLDAGLLRGADASFYAPLPFQGSGRICKMTIAYEDAVQAPGLKVSLLRKNVVYGGSAELAPSVLAAVSSAPGTYNWVQRGATTAISEANIDSAKAYYFVKAEFVGDGGQDVGLLGVMVDIRKEC